MKYINAQDILPEDMIKALQQYVDGSYIYIPRKAENKKAWGVNSKIKNELRERNIQIFDNYCKGSSIKELANTYYLTENSIRRIIREYKVYNR